MRELGAHKAENDALRTLIEGAESNEAGRAARQRVCRVLATTFRQAGQRLWVCGYILGTDRRDGRSPFKFGSDATVGLGIVAQIAGELTSGAVTLLECDNLYGAAALLRQLVEVEYLAWAFAEDQEEATRWLRSTREERRELWQPRHLRARSDGRFRSADYGQHCDRGGHPTPDAMPLLPDHQRRQSAALWWFDLASHGVSAWEYAVEGADHLGYGDELRSAASTHGLRETIACWKHDDPLRDATEHVSKMLAADEED